MASQTVPLSDLHDEQPQTVKLSDLSDQPKTAQEPSSKGALVLQAVAKVEPVAADLAERFATNPNVAKTVASVGRVVGGAAPMVSNPTNPMSYLATSGGAWSGGKAGYFLGKNLQKVVAPIATALDAAKPYMQAVSTLSGVQGALDLAQMAEPKRQDIGFLGIGGKSSAPLPADALSYADSQKRAELVALANGRKLTMPEALAQMLPIETVTKLVDVLRGK